MSANCLSDCWRPILQTRYEYSEKKSDFIWIDDNSATAEDVFIKSWQDIEYILIYIYIYMTRYIWPRIWLIVSKYIYSKFLRILRCILSSAVSYSMRPWIIANLSNSEIWWFNCSWRGPALVNFLRAMQKFFNRINLVRTRSYFSISLSSSIVETAIIYTRIKKINEQLTRKMG